MRFAPALALRRVALGRHRRVGAAGALGLAVVALVVLIASVGGGGDKAPQAATTSTATTEIRRQDLVEVDEEDGTLGYSDERPVVNRLSGTVTSLPHEGALVKPGHTLFRVDKTPVILMDGPVPAYRKLSASVSDGVDVEQLEHNLRALGYDPAGAVSVDRHWTSATTAAVERWQSAHGFSQTGSIELGRVVFQPGTRRVSSVEGTLGGDAGSAQGSGSSAGASTTGASYHGSGATLRFASYTTTTTPTTTTPAPENKTKTKTKNQTEAKKKTRTGQRQQSTTTTQQQTAAPSGSAAQQSGGSGGSSGGASSSAQQSSPAATLLKTTSTRSQVVVKLDTAKESLAKKGARVTVQLPSGQSARGRIASVGKVATKTSSTSSQGSTSDSSSSSSNAATVPVKIRISSAAALDQAPATVRFEKSRRKNVLAIPVTALLARAGGKFAVEVRTGGARRLVEVTPGLYTSGYVEIDGEGLQPGMKVTDARV